MRKSWLRALGAIPFVAAGLVFAWLPFGREPVRLGDPAAWRPGSGGVRFWAILDGAASLGFAALCFAVALIAAGPRRPPGGPG